MFSMSQARNLGLSIRFKHNMLTWMIAFFNNMQVQNLTNNYIFGCRQYLKNLGEIKQNWVKI